MKDVVKDAIKQVENPLTRDRSVVLTVANHTNVLQESVSDNHARGGVAVPPRAILNEAEE